MEGERVEVLVEGVVDLVAEAIIALPTVSGCGGKPREPSLVSSRPPRLVKKGMKEMATH